MAHPLAAVVCLNAISSSSVQAAAGTTTGFAASHLHHTHQAPKGKLSIKKHTQSHPTTCPYIHSTAASKHARAAHRLLLNTVVPAALFFVGWSAGAAAANAPDASTMREGLHCCGRVLSAPMKRALGVLLPPSTTGESLRGTEPQATCTSSSRTKEHRLLDTWCGLYHSKSCATHAWAGSA